MIKRGRPIFFFLFLLLCLRLGANETKDGYIRMLIDEKTGRFSLSFLTDTENSKYSQLFYRGGNTSFFDININGVPYRLGESRVFTTRVDRENDEPVVIYDSALITVKTSFTPVKTSNSPNANGIRVTIQIMNNTEEEPEVGLRLVIDTILGEGRKNIPFITENFNIKKEKIIESSSDEKYWISRGKDIALMGSIADPLDETAARPDYLHFANWQKLSDVPWKASYHEGRSFNKLPYSIGDSAVSYYWNPVVLEMGRALTYNVYLTTEDAAWYQPKQYAAPVKPVAPKPPAPVIEEKKPEVTAEPEAVVFAPEEEPVAASENNMAVIEQEAQAESQKTGEDYHITVLRMMQDVLNKFIAGEISLNEYDLIQMDIAKEKYGQIQENQ
jgi:hypothetical protein